MNTSDLTCEETPLFLFHGMGVNSTTLIALNNYLKIKGIETHNINYPVNKLSFDECLDFAHNKIIDTVGEDTPINVLGHSFGGLISINLHKTGLTNIHTSQSLCSPLQDNLDIIKWGDKKAQVIMKCINNPGYDYLRTKSVEIEPQHKYLTYSAGMWKSNNDLILKKHECMLNEKNHTHFYWTDHYTAPFNIFVQKKLYTDLKASYD